MGLEEMEPKHTSDFLCVWVRAFVYSVFICVRAPVFPLIFLTACLRAHELDFPGVFLIDALNNLLS